VRLVEDLASSAPAVTAIGGTYLDVELLVDTHLRSDVSLEVLNRSTAVGGPGFCHALQLARLGIAVNLITKLGSCAASHRARQVLREHGVTSAAITEVVAADLDVATLAIDPTGRKLAFNEHKLARTIECDPGALRRDTPLLVASPTSLLSVVRALQECDRWGWRPRLFFAPHSRQVSEFLTLRGPERDMLCSTIAVACVNASDFDADFNAALGERTLLVVTNGANGCAVRGRAAWTTFPAHSVRLARPNTNGAGEAFFAGMVAALMRGARADSAVQSALANAAGYLERRPIEVPCEEGTGRPSRPKHHELYGGQSAC
jgi:sugar/nucleoside kinase (ribokinase family)